MKIFSQVDFAHLHFVLDFTSPCQLQAADFATLSGALRMAGRTVLENAEQGDVARWNALFQPRLSDDPVALRKFQKPAPAFVLRWPFSDIRHIDAGDQIVLEVLFLGTGIQLIHSFLRSLMHLGNLGLVDGTGCFKVVEVRSVDVEHGLRRAWGQGEVVDDFAPDILGFDWWLTQSPQLSDPLTLKFITPARLMVDGKPLRRPSFSQIFPFLLRRVTSMFYAHCGVEVVELVPDLMAASADVELVSKTLTWHDWRSLGTGSRCVLGGFVGEMTLTGSALDEIDWVLAAATLWGIGKGAANGAGRICLY